MPAGVKFIQVSAGRQHSMALDSEGRIWTWGFDSDGQLGRSYDSSKPHDRPGLADTPAGLTFIAISAGAYHCTALDRDGNIWTWGSNGRRQLGYDTVDRLSRSPTGLKIPKATFIAISAANSTMALDANGTVWTWGGSDRSGSTTDDDLLGHAGFRPAPVDTDVRFTTVRVGNAHSIGIAQDGTIYTWGYNSSGQLGRTPTDAEPAGRPNPVPGLTGATSVMAGYAHSTAITDTGAWAWGDNSDYQLGAPVNGSSSTPVSILVPEGTPAGFRYTSLMISPTASHTLLFGTDGDVYGFGRNQCGQLGTIGHYYNTTMVWRPLGTTVASVAFGAKRSAKEMERRPDGWYTTSPQYRPGTVTLTIRSYAGTGSVWPENAVQAKDTSQKFTYTGDTVTLTFVSEHGAPTPAQQVMPGESTRRPADPTEEGWAFDGWFDGDVAYDFAAPLEHNLTVTGRWHRPGRWVLSSDRGGEYGGELLTLTAPPTPDIRMASVDTGGSSSLGIGSDGNLYAWGDNTQGQLGDGTRIRRTTPTRISRPDGTDDGFFWVQATAGRTHSAAVGSDGNLYTWGTLTGGLGDTARTTSSTRPIRVTRPDGTEPGFTWLRTAAGNGYTMATGSDGNLYTWGTLTGGLGDTARTTSSARPVKVAPPEDAFADFHYERISAGDQHALAFGTDDYLYTWGSNAHGQLGHDDTGTPAAAANPDPKRPSIRYTQASAGGDHTLAIDQQGTIWTWGRLADSTDTATPSFKYVTGVGGYSRLTYVAAGRAHDIVSSNDNRIWTWGDNSKGQLGRLTDKPGEADSSLPGQYTSFTAAGDTTIAIDIHGNIQTWGDNALGQGGHGDTDETPTPRDATFPPNPTPTSLTIDNTTLPLRQTAPNTWQTNAPQHNPGSVPVCVQWTLAGQAQPDDTTNTYTYLHQPVHFTLPNSGSTGLILLIIAGTLTLAAAAANRYHQQHTLPTSSSK
ncbi:hypothetical protein DKK72_06970 [Bifidobacterium indicum]|nr:hypothetical protein DKK72_06970 [Bifidobacterium indicum]